MAKKSTADWGGCLIMIMMSLLGCEGPGTPDKPVVGITEWVVFPVSGHRALAKVDTGADSSSIDATDIRGVGDGEGALKPGDVIRFLTRRADGDRHELRGTIVRFVRIKRKGMNSQRRPVVEVEVCIGGRKMRTEMTLTDRHNFKFSALIGRNVLDHGFLVDVARKELWKAECPAD